MVLKEAQRTSEREDRKAAKGAGYMRYLGLLGNEGNLRGNHREGSGTRKAAENEGVSPGTLGDDREHMGTHQVGSGTHGDTWRRLENPGTDEK